MKLFSKDVEQQFALHLKMELLTYKNLKSSLNGIFTGMTAGKSGLPAEMTNQSG